METGSGGDVVPTALPSDGDGNVELQLLKKQTFY